MLQLHAFFIGVFYAISYECGRLQRLIRFNKLRKRRTEPG